MDQKTRTIYAAGLSSISDDARGEAGELVPLNLAATGAGKQDGVFVEQLPAGTAVEAHTANHVYRIQKLAEGKALISGHEKYCPEPVLVNLQGTRWLHGPPNLIQRIQPMSNTFFTIFQIAWK